MERARLERASSARRAVAALVGRARGAAGARPDQPAENLAEMGAVRPPAVAELVARRGGANWGRCPSDAALFGPRRGDGDRGRRGGGAMSRANAGRRDSSAARLLRGAARAGLESAAAGDAQWAGLTSGGPARRAA